MLGQMSEGKLALARGRLSDGGRSSEMHQWRELGFSKEREGESQTELWPQTETDERWEARNACSHNLTENPDKFFHQCIKETLHVDTWSCGNRYFVQRSSFSNRSRSSSPLIIVIRLVVTIHLVPLSCMYTYVCVSIVKTDYMTHLEVRVNENVGSCWVRPRSV